MIQPAIATVSLGRAAAGHDILHKLEEASIAGFQGVEVFFECLEHFAHQTFDVDSCGYRPCMIEAAKAVQRACITHGLKVVCLQPFMFYDGLIDELEHSNKLQTLRLWFELCHELHTDLIQVPTNFQSYGTTGERNRLIADMAEIAKLGLKESPIIRFAYEGISWGNHIDTWEGTWEVVNTVNLPNLGLCLDVFHIAGRVWADPTVDSGRVQNSDVVLEASLNRLIDLVDPTKIFYLQVGDAEHLVPPLSPSHQFYLESQKPRMSWSRNARLFPFELEQGGYLPVWQICKTILIDLKWDGWVSMEMFGRCLYEQQQALPQALAQRAIRSWQTLLDHLASPVATGTKSATGAAVVGDPVRSNDEEEKRFGSGRVFIFGHPISHSLSPIFNNTLWDCLQIPWYYDKLDSPKIDDLVANLRLDDCVGASVTMPHKARVMDLVDELTEEAQMIGAVNTIVIKRDIQTGEKRYLGANLDCIGMRDALEQTFNGIKQQVKAKIGLVVGGGATARTAIFTLSRYFQIDKIYIVNRDKDEIEEIMRSTGFKLPKVQLIHVETLEDAANCQHPAIAVGAVPDIAPVTAAEYQAKEVALTLINLRRFSKVGECFFLDMCYHPSPNTTLLNAAQQAGWETINGVEVLIAINRAQNVLWLGNSFERLWTDEIDLKIRMALKAHM